MTTVTKQGAPISRPPVARYLPWVACGLTVLIFLMQAAPSAEAPDGMNIPAFGAITTLDGGRYKPVDTYARLRVFVISHRQTVTAIKPYPNQPRGSAADEGITERQSATRWLLDLMSVGLLNYYGQVFITDPQLIDKLGLEPKQMVFGIFDDLRPKEKEIEKWARAAEKKDPDQRDRFDRNILALQQTIEERSNRAREIAQGLHKRGINPNKVQLFRIESDQVLNMLGLKPREGLRYSYAEVQENEARYDQFALMVKRIGRREEKPKDEVEARALELANSLGAYRDISRLGGPGLVPGEQTDQAWQSLGQALLAADLSGQPNPKAQALADILYSYATGKADQFNKQVAEYRADLAKEMPRETSTSWLELFLHHFEPFYLCAILYVLAFFLCLGALIALCCGSSTWWNSLNRSAFYMCIIVVVVHTWALGMRMVIQGRPPVTNLYSSAVFIGWGCVLLCLFLEAIYKNGLGTIVASVQGAWTLIFAIHLAGSGEDTMEMMRAVLDTNFWLATHVVAVATGYTATLVAGTLALFYIILGVWTPVLTKEVSKNLGHMIYGVLCFATLLSFVGTVLGGIWADQSWGRFWGWDPKENGALMIVIWNALILHARWGGMVKERGMAILAVAGNMIVGWSYVGTNQLGIGLHAYGFNNTMAIILLGGWVFCGAVIIMGLLPQGMWRSFAATKPPLPPPPDGGRSKGKHRTGLKPAHTG